MILANQRLLSKFPLFQDEFARGQLAETVILPQAVSIPFPFEIGERDEFSLIISAVELVQYDLPHPRCDDERHPLFPAEIIERLTAVGQEVLRSRKVLEKVPLFGIGLEFGVLRAQQDY